MPTDPVAPLDWTIVVPVKGAPNAKSRLGASPEQALAIALDTVEAAVVCGRVLVVVPSAFAESFRAVGAAVVDDPGHGLNAAVVAGARAAGSGPTAILLGDLPALRPVELADALDRADALPRAVVADAAGSGTVLLTSTGALPHRPAFGPGSHALHLLAGYVDLPFEAASGLRLDVDTPADLESLRGRLGPRSTRAFAESGTIES